ncbi:hypothetical protein EWM60_18180 [Candidatus Erwinia dacicola]|nr:hypothetical protein [Candidatus Erwinia dacicola]
MALTILPNLHHVLRLYLKKPTKIAKNCSLTTLAMVFKLLKPAQKNWNRLKGFELLTLVVNNLPFKNSKQVEEEASDRNVA